MHHPIAARETLHGRRGGSGLHLAFDITLLVALARRCHRSAATRRREQSLRNIAQEAARERGLGAAVQVAPESAAEIKAIFRSGHSDVAEAALLGHLRGRADRGRVLLALVQRALVRQQPLLHADHEDNRKLQALDHVEGDQRRALAVLVVGVDIRDEGHLGEKIFEALRGVAVVEAFGKAAELVEIFDPCLPLRRAVEVMPAQVHHLDDLVDQLARAQDAHGRAHRLDLRAKTEQRSQRSLRHTGNSRRICEQSHDVGFGLSREGVDRLDGDAPDLARRD